MLCYIRNCIKHKGEGVGLHNMDAKLQKASPRTNKNQPVSNNQQ
jgi:hypothetical protein